MHIAAPVGLTTMEANAVFKELGGTARSVRRFLADRKADRKDNKEFRTFCEEYEREHIR